MHRTEIGAGGHAVWRRSLARALRSVAELRRRLRLFGEEAPAGDEVAGFPLLVTESLVRRMRPGDPDDPVLLQVLPTAEEADSPPGFVHDPVGDGPARRAPGMLHKYEGRALLLVSGACAVHCRYCFRRHYPYEADARGFEHYAPALLEIARDPSLREVILSGGDPLIRSDAWLARLARALADVPHLNTLRVHTRLPVVLPDRVTDELLGWLAGTRLNPVVVLHVNHANELVGDCVDALARLRRAGVLLLNQAVLLRKVNDSVEALAELSERLFELGVLPYYLHQLDRVAGAAAFEVPEAKGETLVGELRRRLPGYLVPRYVRETPGEPCKTPIA
jgi:EF-P beta-lysylation protein EpmB